jgi:hypothetical protein
MKGPWPKNDKLRQNLHGTILKGKSIGLNPKKEIKRRAHDLKNQDASWGPNQGPTQGFNLFQMNTNCFLGIWTLDPHL